MFTPILIVDDGLVMPSAAGIRKQDSAFVVWKACMSDLAFYSSDALAPENGAAKATKRIGIQTATKTNDLPL